MKTPPSILSANGEPFEDNYWKQMYVEDKGSVIDGMFNAKEHANYALQFFKLIEVEIKRLGDFGFGLGVLLEEFAYSFKPNFIVALDPSKYCVERLLKQKWHKKFNLVVHHQNFQDFKTDYLENEPLDLVILNSVLQYFPSSRFEEQIAKLSKICKYLYVTVPTKKDYKKMKEDLNFIDPYAYSRSAKFYKKAFEKYFSFISYNIMVSRKSSFEKPFLYELFFY